MVPLVPSAAEAIDTRPLGSYVELAPVTDDDSRDGDKIKTHMALPMSKPSRQDREEAWSRVDFREVDVDILYAFDRDKAPSR